MKRTILFGIFLVILTAFALPAVSSAAVGDFITQWGEYGFDDGQFQGPYDVAVDKNGNVYVTDVNNARIQKFDGSGNFLTKWGSPGSGNGQFAGLRGIGVDGSGNVYVADRSNNRIQKFDGDGNYITQWGSQGSGDGQFNYPMDVAVDTDGNVYVADCYNSRIQKFDSNGTYITQWNHYGTISYPLSITVDTFGVVYVVTQYDVRSYDTSGNFLGGLPMGLTAAAGIAVDLNGTVYVVDNAQHCIVVFVGDNRWGSQGSGAGQFHYPWGVAADAGGNVYVADTGNNRIQKFAGVSFYNFDGFFRFNESGTLYDLLFEILKDGVVVGTGQIDAVFGSRGGFQKALLQLPIAYIAASPPPIPGDTLGLRISVRIAAESEVRNGTAWLLFNDDVMNSGINVKIAGVDHTYYLVDGFALSESPSLGPKKTIAVSVDREKNENAFKPFGTWSITLPQEMK